MGDEQRKGSGTHDWFILSKAMFTQLVIMQKCALAVFVTDLFAFLASTLAQLSRRQGRRRWGCEQKGACRR